MAWCLTHWGRVTLICVSKLIIIGSDNGLSPGRLQAIVWTDAGILLIGPLGTNFSEILIGIDIFSIKEMQLKISSAKCRPFCLGLNELSTRASVATVLSTHLCISSCLWIKAIYALFGTLHICFINKHSLEVMNSCVIYCNVPFRSTRH